jgi:HEAT repeat protein
VARPAMRALAPTEPVESRRRAVEALSRLEDDRAVEPLVSALADEDEEVRAEATKALKRTKRKLETEERARDVEVRRLTRQMLD